MPLLSFSPLCSGPLAILPVELLESCSTGAATSSTMAKIAQFGETDYLTTPLWVQNLGGSLPDVWGLYDEHPLECIVSQIVFETSKDAMNYIELLYASISPPAVLPVCRSEHEAIVASMLCTSPNFSPLVAYGKREFSVQLMPSYTPPDPGPQ